MDVISEANLASKGSKEAFVKLIKFYEKDLYRVGTAMLKNDHDALDAVQETLLNAYNNIKKLKKPEYFKTWIIKILINNCNKILNSKKKVISIDKIADKGSNSKEYEVIEIREIVDKLDEELKALVILYYYEDMSVKDISQSLDIPQGTIKSRLSRARGKLYDALTKFGKESVCGE